MKEQCKECKIRKFYAKLFDKHFDNKDCPMNCVYNNNIDNEKDKGK